jgi:hypothetical protein
MLKFSPRCPACESAIPLRWRLGLRKSWGACDQCGIVIRELFLRKVVCSGVFLAAMAFMWFGEPWVAGRIVRGLLGLLAIAVAHLTLPGFEIRDERRNG